MSEQRPLRWVVMGVSGCGKSTLAEALAQQMQLRLVDGDDLHLPESVRKMSIGIALSDEDRWPWLDRVAQALLTPLQRPKNAGCVVACSALRRVYRDRLRAQVPGLQFIFLNGSADLLHQRMTRREGHFMLLQLLSSQLATLEIPAPDEVDVLTLPAERSLKQLVLDVSDALDNALTNPFQPDLKNWT